MESPEEKQPIEVWWKRYDGLLCVCTGVICWIVFALVLSNMEEWFKQKAGSQNETITRTIVELYETDGKNLTPTTFPIGEGTTYQEHWFGGGVTITIKDMTIQHHGAYAIKQEVVHKESPKITTHPPSAAKRLDPRLEAALVAEFEEAFGSGKQISTGTPKEFFKNMAPLAAGASASPPLFEASNWELNQKGK